MGRRSTGVATAKDSELFPFESPLSDVLANPLVVPNVHDGRGLEEKEAAVFRTLSCV